VCGCGSCGDAIDAAYRVVAAEKDCYHWHQTVDGLVMIIRGNLLARKMVSEGVPEILIETAVHRMMNKEADRANDIGAENSEEIAALCDALFEQGQGETQ
jgi:hypothetical protein